MPVHVNQNYRFSVIARDLKFGCRRHWGRGSRGKGVCPLPPWLSLVLWHVSAGPRRVGAEEHGARYPMRVVVARVRAAYDLIAPVFADRVKGARQSVESFAEELAAHLGPGAPVLDLGCGPAYDT